MSHVTTHDARTQQQFTIDDTGCDLGERVTVVKTKRYTFCWLLGEEPLLLAVRDYDGTDVTDRVEPPDGMAASLARYG